MGTMATTALGCALAYGFGGTLVKNIWSGNDHFKSCIGRAAMQVSVTALAYLCGGYLMPEHEGNPLLTAALAVGGFWGACRVVDNILFKGDRFETLAGRIRETTVSLGVAIAMLHIGSKCGVTPLDTLSATISTTSWVASTGLSLASEALSGAASLLF